MALAGPGEFAAQLQYSRHFVEYVKLFSASRRGASGTQR
jgi:hypothetical protein